VTFVLALPTGCCYGFTVTRCLLVWGLIGALAGTAGCAKGDTDVSYDAAAFIETHEAGAHHDGTFAAETSRAIDTGADIATTSPPDGSIDADAETTTEAGGDDSGTCGANSHLCGATCTPNALNSPNVGCSQSCGAACAAPANATSTCTDAGTCGFECNPGVNESDAGCGCPSGAVSCSGTCQQCCTDSDCTNLGLAHTACTGGTCSGCAANWGNCDGSGCNTDLTTTDNCGFCGDGCSTGFGGGCGFLGLGGQSCDGPAPYSCGC